MQAASRSTRVIELIKAGIDIRVHSKHKIEHNKFGVFDKKIVITGSFNWTTPASEFNSENCAIMPESNAVMAYKRRFETFWDMNSAAKSKAAIINIETALVRRVVTGQ
ncbi:MAG: hypothetical protein HY072_10575 [Deltaproteobacteria bacterium]|nr:hypothetical protein [Deltaproteobacteria bacterium]